MLTVGRPRSKHKDLPLGVRIVAGRYYVRPVNESMRRVFERTFPGRRTAPLGADKEAMRQQWVKLFCSPPSDAAAGTVGEIIDRFIADELPRINSATGRPYYAPATQANYRGSAKRLKAKFGAMRYAKTPAESAGNVLRRMHVTAYLRDNERTRPASANQDVVCLASALRFACDCGLTDFNPLAGGKLAYNPHVPRPQLPSDDLFLKVYQHASPILQCMMDLAQMCGPRRGSIAGITLADIRDDGLRVVHNKGRRGQPPSETIYEWAPELRAVIDRALEIRAKRRGGGTVQSIYLFLTTWGGKFSKSGLDSQWERAIVKAGIERDAFHFHDIRAKNASTGESDLDAMKRLGHTDMRTTRKVYRRKPDKVTPLNRTSGRKGE
jgi:integrase